MEKYYVTEETRIAVNVLKSEVLEEKAKIKNYKMFIVYSYN